MNLYHLVGYSQLTYKNPIRPRKGENVRFWENTITHIGRDAHALDIIIPDPRTNPLPIWVPQSGRIIELVQHHLTWGATSAHEHLLNYIKVEVLKKGKSTGEVYVIAHIAAGSCPFSIGDIVAQDAFLATTGVNGRMTDVRHTHFVVGKKSKKYPGGYASVRARWDKNQKDASM